MLIELVIFCSVREKSFSDNLRNLLFSMDTLSLYWLLGQLLLLDFWRICALFFYKPILNENWEWRISVLSPGHTSGRISKQISYVWNSNDYMFFPISQANYTFSYDQTSYMFQLFVWIREREQIFFASSIILIFYI